MLIVFVLFHYRASSLHVLSVLLTLPTLSVALAPCSAAGPVYWIRGQRGAQVTISIPGYGYIYYDGQTLEVSGSSVLRKQVEKLVQLQHQMQQELADEKKSAPPKQAPKQQEAPVRGLQPVPEAHKEGNSQGSATSGPDYMSALPDERWVMLQGGLQGP